MFNYMIEDMESNEKLSPIVTELFLRERSFLYHNLISKCLIL